MIQTLKNIAKKCIYHSAIKYYYLCDLYSYLNSLKRYKNFSKRIKKFTNSGEIEKYKKICIFASYGKLSTSSKLYIKALGEINYGVVFVNNLPIAPDDYEFLKNNSILSFNRINLGRDVGAFKDIFLYLSSSGYLDNLELLGFANDSVQFIPGKYANKFQKSIKKFEESNSEALFTHFSNQSEPHFQSFFSILKSNIFRSNQYKSFWKKYLPISNREHSIHNGEIKISSKIYNKIKNKTVLYSTSNLSNSFTNLKKDNCSELLNINILELLPSFTRTIRNQGESWNYMRIVTKNPSIRNLNNQNIDNSIFELIENNNPSHVGAFLYPLFLKCPLIKKDLTSQGSFTMGHSLNLYTRCLQSSMDLNDPIQKDLYGNLLREYDLLLIEKGSPYAFRHKFFKGIRLGIYKGFQYDFS